MQLHFGAKGIDRRADSGILLIHRFVMEGLCGLQLSLRGLDPCAPGQSLKICVPHGEHDQVASIFVRVLRRLLAVGGSTLAVQRFEAEQRLREVHAGVEVTVRADNFRESREAQSPRCQIILRGILAGRSGQVGEEFTELFPLLSPSGNGVVTLQQQTQVVFQPTVNGIPKRKRQYLGGSFALRDAAGKRILAKTPARAIRHARC